MGLRVPVSSALFEPMKERLFHALEDEVDRILRVADHFAQCDNVGVVQATQTHHLTQRSHFAPERSLFLQSFHGHQTSGRRRSVEHFADLSEAARTQIADKLQTLHPKNTTQMTEKNEKDTDLKSLDLEVLGR